MNRTPMEVTIRQLVEAAGLAAEFESCRASGESFHLAITNSPYMRLVVEIVTKGEVSIAHYYTQNGDAMRDPEIVFNASWLPVEITQDPLGIHRRASDGYYLRGVQDLARMWATNIRHQGFVKRGAFESATHTVKAARPMKLAA